MWRKLNTFLCALVEMFLIYVQTDSVELGLEIQFILENRRVRASEMFSSTTPTHPPKPSPARSFTGGSVLRGGSSTSHNQSSNADFLESAEYVVQSLKSLEFPREISVSMFVDKSTTQGVLEVTNFLLQKIDPGVRLENLEDLPAILKFLSYPGAILQRSQWNLSGISGGKHLMPIYHWLTELVVFDQHAIAYPEVRSSNVLELMRVHSDGTRDSEILEGICTYVINTNLMENPGNGTLWETCTLEETDIDEFLATVSRIDAKALEEAWQFVSRFHEHLIHMMGKQAEMRLTELKDDLRRREERYSVNRAWRADYESLTEKLQTNKKDIDSVKKQTEEMVKGFTSMQGETQVWKNACLSKQQEINAVNTELHNLRNALTKQGLNFVDAERLREDTSTKMAKSEEMQSRYQSFKSKIADSERKMRSEFKMFGSIWREFVSIIINESSSHLPNCDAVRQCVRAIRCVLTNNEERENRNSSRAAKTHQLSLLLDYDEVLSFISTQKEFKCSANGLLNDILKMDSAELLEKVKAADKTIRLNAVQEVKNNLSNVRRRFERDQEQQRTVLEDHKRRLERTDLELQRVTIANEKLESGKSDREKALLEEIHQAEEKLAEVRRAHQAALDQRSNLHAKRLQELQDYMERVGMQKDTVMKQWQDYEKLGTSGRYEFQKLGNDFKDSIIEMTLAIPNAILFEFPLELQRKLRIADKELSDSAQEEGVPMEEDDSENGTNMDEQESDREVSKMVDENASGDNVGVSSFTPKKTKRLHAMIQRMESNI
eukprot:Gregarina_sp_Poly_1__9998@NODE_665_length_6873_cov_524_942404_g503_i0_p2_GENE_NODE_665_length_6873_cov_524_942404_g503_i0NODE_665_length_6873_cov_524_942404_g503_i0_p2_ORF_typecomplete_len777_score136_30Ndc80_HEC/PF03801_13/6e09Ndc80_HEC/PF03801_13/9_3e03CCCAP/PF15964_5/0_00016KASH_CCD/PF14662_6/0_0065KASH_CCD/PF14662_6/1_1e04Bap31_Bap29_C/PF18035_1/0_17AAA_13/PF13166_6/0_044AAA_13/PF13166_6/43DUF2563/PF10817_8/36DUF2563/PF10817_8/6_9e03DUF2563/PF10817_8/33Filament/PF00038_21/1_8Filament/PF00038